MPVQSDPDSFNNVEDAVVNENLTAFTDRLLDNQEPDMYATSNEELMTLQKSVYRLQQTFGRQQPDPVMAQRILSRLIVEWRALQQQKRGSIWQRLLQAPLIARGWRSGHGRRQLTATALALSLIVVVAISLLFVSPEPGALPGTVPAQQPFSLLMLVPVLLGGGVIWWFLSRRRE
jgi:hypothetical protein